MRNAKRGRLQARANVAKALLELDLLWRPPDPQKDRPGALRNATGPTPHDQDTADFTLIAPDAHKGVV